MQTIRCPLGNEIAHFYCRKPPADYYILKDTGLIFQKSPPSIDEMAAYADTEYACGLYKDYVAAASLKHETFRRRIRLIRNFVERGRLLDVGCASGFFIEMALEQGFDAYGIEFSKTAIALAKQEIQPRIMHGDVNLLRERGQKCFDLVVAFDIIEHTHNPIKFLMDIREILAPGGWLILATPDTGHFLRHLMRSRWPMLQPLQHTYLFSRKAMRKVLEEAGYNRIQVQNAEKTMTLEYLIGQISASNPFLTGVYKAFSRLLPTAVTEKPFSINIGEMLVFCQKGS